MVRILISLRGALTRGQLQSGSRGPLITGLVLGLASAGGTLYLGLASYPSRAAGTDVIAMLSALWLGGLLAQRALTGEPTLRPELFALLPARRRSLALALIAVNLTDPALLFLALPFGSVIAFGAQSGVIPALAGAAGVVLVLALAAAGATILGGVLGPGSGRGHDIGTIVTALALSAVAAASGALPLLIGSLRDRSLGWLSVLVRVLPSGWPAVAADAAARSAWLWVALPLAGLVVLAVLVALAWPAVLTRRMTGAGRRPRGARAHAGRRALLPTTPAGAVTAKELRLWVRDPTRLTTLLIAVVVAAATCLVPKLTQGSAQLFPFAGAGTALIAGAAAVNLYGNDGTSVWLTGMVPGSARADVRGRQLAWLLLVGPYAVAVTVALTALSRQWWAWPWALSILPAVLGGAAGLIPLGSLTWVVPLDAGGGPTPPYSLKVHIAIIVLALTAVPPAALAVAGSAAGLSWLTWLAVPAGLATGPALAAALGALAARRLQGGQAALLRAVAPAG